MKLAAYCLLVVWALLSVGCGGGPGEGVAARVNGYNITYAELERYYQNEVRERTIAPTRDEERVLRLTLLRELIDREILFRKAEQLGLVATDSEVEASLKEYQSPYETDEQFQKHLEERGMTLDDIREELRRTLAVEKLFTGEIRSKITVPEAELRAYYKENKASFNVPEQQVHLAQIVVTAVPEVPVPNHRNDDAKDLETAQKKIEMIEQRLKDGEDFAVVAQNYSEDPVSTASGGDLGFVPQSALGQADVTLRRVVASLSPGEFSPIIRTDNEFRIIKLLSTEQAGQREFEDPRVQQSIREMLMNRKDQLLKAAFLEVARNGARIENYLAEQVVEDFGASD